MRNTEAQEAQGPTGGLLLVNGCVHTLDPAVPQATAIWCEGERIRAVGDTEEVERAARLGASSPPQRIDLKGLTVVPAFADAHVHFREWAAQSGWEGLERARSLEEALEVVAQAARSLSPGSGRWLTGWGWNRNAWDKPVAPTRQALDRVAPGLPIVLRSKDGHMVWASSAALAAAGIDAGTPDPPGGRIEREADGQPSGLLFETAAEPLERVMPAPTEEEVDGLLEAAQRRAHSLGIASVHVPEDGASLGAFLRLRAAGRLSLRVCMMLPVALLGQLREAGIRSGLGDHWVRIGPLKLFSDGSLGARTAAMLEPYDDVTPESRGILVYPPEELKRIVAEATEAGFSLAIHAIGDRANREVLDALERVLPATRSKGLRHRIEHVQLLHPEDLPRLARLGVVASMQPIHSTSDRDMVDRFWGRERGRLAYAFRSLLAAGTRLAFGSDAPVEPIEPLRGMYAAVARKRETEPEREPWFPEEGLAPEQALRAYTEGAAYAEGQEGRKGRLAPGMLADLVVLSKDPLRAAMPGSSGIGAPEPGSPSRESGSLPPESCILRNQVVATVVAGRRVFGEWP